MQTETATRHDLETALIEKCWKDPEFKKVAGAASIGVSVSAVGTMISAIEGDKVWSWLQFEAVQTKLVRNEIQKYKWLDALQISNRFEDLRAHPGPDGKSRQSGRKPPVPL